MESNTATVTISKEEFLRYYETERILEGQDLTKPLMYVFNYMSGYGKTLQVLNPSDEMIALANRVVAAEEESRNIQSKLDNIQDKWWYKLFNR